MVAATCDIKTTIESNVAPLTVKVIKQSNSRKAVQANKLSQNHLCKLSDKSTTGPPNKSL